MNQNEIWLSVLDYANAKKTSISTIRRSIKSGHLKYRTENGKYYIWTKEVKKDLIEDNKYTGLFRELELIKRKNRELIEEINDLKMLLNAYEGMQQITLPPMPEMEL